MATQGLKETMPGGVGYPHIWYGCESCSNHNPEHHQSCGINLMLPVALLMNGWRTQCPLHNKTEKEIEEFFNSKEHGS